jgi:hypothetical protein
MTQREMRDQVARELKHIPKWPGEHQGRLRAFFQMKRMWSLGKNADRSLSAGDVLQECIAHLRKDSPDAKVLYDSEFFENAPAGV